MVEQIGPAVTAFKPGDKVAVNRCSKTLGDPRFGAFQQSALALVNSSSKLDQNTDLAAAAAVIINLAAVVSALSIHMNLTRPSLSGVSAPPTRGKLLVYGGSSSCGGLAIKYAVDAGYTVITTSSPQNYAFVSTLGAATIIDHTQPANKILAELREHEPYDAIFDSIGLTPVTNILGELLTPKGGAYNTLIPLNGDEKPLPANVERKFAPYSWALEEEANAGIARWFYEEYVPKGLASGQIIPTRQEIVEGGLGKVQEVLDRMGAGAVSGHKLVMNPWN